MVDDARHSAREKFEAPTEGADHEGIEAVVTGKDFSLEMVGLIRLFAEKNGMNFRAIEKYNPVAGEFGMEDGDKVDVVFLGEARLRPRPGPHLIGGRVPGTALPDGENYRSAGRWRSVPP